jgi:hypothetical protein
MQQSVPLLYPCGALLVMRTHSSSTSLFTTKKKKLLLVVNIWTVTGTGNAMRMRMRKSDQSMIFPVFFFLKKKSDAMQCKIFRFFASRSHFCIALNFLRFRIFASH